MPTTLHSKKIEYKELFTKLDYLIRKKDEQYRRYNLDNFTESPKFIENEKIIFSIAKHHLADEKLPEIKSIEDIAVTFQKHDEVVISWDKHIRGYTEITSNHVLIMIPASVSLRTINCLCAIKHFLAGYRKHFIVFAKLKTINFDLQKDRRFDIALLSNEIFDKWCFIFNEKGNLINLNDSIELVQQWINESILESM